MQTFRDYLETKRIVTKKRAPYYVAWVSQFFNYFYKKPNDGISSEEIEFKNYSMLDMVSSDRNLRYLLYIRNSNNIRNVVIFKS